MEKTNQNPKTAVKIVKKLDRPPHSHIKCKLEAELERLETVRQRYLTSKGHESSVIGEIIVAFMDLKKQVAYLQSVIEKN